MAANSLLERPYRLDYWLPDDGLVKIELIERATGNNDVILIKSGGGVEAFTVLHAVIICSISSHWTTVLHGRSRFARWGRTLPVKAKFPWNNRIEIKNNWQ